MRGLRERLRSEQGAALIHVGLAIFVLTGLSAFVLDMGVMWLGRRQAQNAADAGALAGAIARAFDETANPPSVGGLAQTSATLAAQANGVVGAGASNVVTWTCPPFAAGSRCVQVDVFRDGTNASAPLPTFLANIFGVTSQPVRATATAEILNGNSTSCMRPWAVIDKWDESVDPIIEYNHWDKAKGALTELVPHDTYVPPTMSGATGYSLTDPPPNGDYGTQVTFKGGGGGPSDAISPGFWLPIDLPDGSGGYPAGGATYRYNIGHCVNHPVKVGDRIPTETGAMIGPTRMGFNDLVALDPGAQWIGGGITGGCCGQASPRVVPLAIFDIDDYQKRRITTDWSGCPGGGSCITVVNILGFFVDRMQGNDVIGYLMTIPGEYTAGGGDVVDDASFIKVIQLIR